eukprot:s258_g18.t1
MLIRALVEAQIVPQDQQPALEAALKPGGLADLLVGGMKLFMLAQENAWALVAVPCGELFLALMLGVLSCRSGLNTWLRADAVYSMLTLAGAWFANLHLEQVLVRVKEGILWDPTSIQFLSLSYSLVVSVFFDRQTVMSTSMHISSSRVVLPASVPSLSHMAYMAVLECICPWALGLALALASPTGTVFALALALMEFATIATWFFQ